MSITRIFGVVIVVCLLVVGALAVRQALAISAITSADHSYDAIERTRSTRGFTSIDDHSYDDIERIRSTRGSLVAADHSYDDIERIRSTRGAMGH